MWCLLLAANAEAATWYADTDGDTYGDAAVTVDGDTAPSGYVADDTDCNDTDAAIHPAAADTCNGLDDDCSGLQDDGGDCPCNVEYDGTHVYQFRTSHEKWTDAQTTCATYGYGLAGVNSAAENTWVDATADAYSTEKWWFGFNDRATEGTWVWDDGSDVTYTNWHSGEPNDSGGDEDCGQFNRYTDTTWNDEPCSSKFYFICEFATPTDWYLDLDGDGYGDPTTGLFSSDTPSGYIADGSDCDDGDVAVNPAATETCNGRDDDCNGAADDGLPTATWYTDADGDTYGDPATSVSACAEPAGASADATDCDDTDATVFPGATETCDHGDDDCDGSVDEGLPTSRWHADADGDTYGDPSTATVDCAAPAGSTADASDCDDTRASVSPAGTEVCNALDDDCDGAVDDVASPPSWYADADRDGYGDPKVRVDACTSPDGYTEDSRDCDDAQSTIHPGALEAKNGRDDDCDGRVDEGLDTGGDTDTDSDTDSDTDTDADTYTDADTDTDTDTDADTDTDTDTDTDAEPDSGRDTADTARRPWDTGTVTGHKCGCEAAGSPSPLLSVLALLLLRRRRTAVRS